MAVPGRGAEATVEVADGVSYFRPHERAWVAVGGLSNFRQSGYLFAGPRTWGTAVPSGGAEAIVEVADDV